MTEQETSQRLEVAVVVVGHGGSSRSEPCHRDGHAVVEMMVMLVMVKVEVLGGRSLLLLL